MQNIILLTAKELDRAMVELNGQELQLEENDELPTINGKIIKAGNVQLPSKSITFITFANKGIRSNIQVNY